MAVRSESEIIQLLLTNNQTSSYTPGSNIEGQVSITTEDPVQVDYKRVIVSLVGRVEVYFTSQAGRSSSSDHWQEQDTFLRKDLIVWNKDGDGRANGGGTNIKLSTGGRYVFPFSFHLTPDTRNRSSSLPSSLDSRDGKIKYTIEAKLIRLGHNETEIDAAATFSRINVRANVDINRSDLLAPRSAQKECISGFFCVGRGPITVTTTIPRSGYCIVIDSIPIQVVVEPGPGQQLQSISASLIQRITSCAQRQPSVLQTVVAKVNNTQMPRKGVSFTWNVPPLEIPDTLELTLTNCGLVGLGYYLRVEYTARCMDVQCIDVPIVIGNVPLANSNSGGLSAASSIQVSGTGGGGGNRGGSEGGREGGTAGAGGYQPVLSLSDDSVGYRPPPIPVLVEDKNERNGTAGNDDENHYDKLKREEKSPLLQN